MKSWKTLYVLASVAILSGCATDIISPGYEDHPNLKAAELARKRGDNPQAIHDYRDIIKENPRCEKAYIGLGTALLDSNYIDESKKTFEQALAIFCDSTCAWVGLGSVYLTIDQPENAIHAFERALCKDPRNAKAHNGLGIALDIMRDHEAAQANYRAAIELSGGNPSYESNLGLSLALAGNTGEAIRILERLACSPCATPRMRQNLSLAYGIAGNMKKAKEVGKVDLPMDLVKENLVYFESIQEVQNNVGLIPKNNDTTLNSARSWQQKQKK